MTFHIWLRILTIVYVQISSLILDNGYINLMKLISSLERYSLRWKVIIIMALIFQFWYFISSRRQNYCIIFALQNWAVGNRAHNMSMNRWTRTDVPYTHIHTYIFLKKIESISESLQQYPIFKFKLILK